METAAVISSQLALVCTGCTGTSWHICIWLAHMLFFYVCIFCFRPPLLKPPDLRKRLLASIFLRRPVLFLQVVCRVNWHGRSHAQMRSSVSVQWLLALYFYSENNQGRKKGWNPISLQLLTEIQFLTSWLFLIEELFYMMKDGWPRAPFFSCDLMRVQCKEKLFGNEITLSHRPLKLSIAHRYTEMYFRRR